MSFDPHTADDQAKDVAKRLSTMVNTRGSFAGLDLAQLIVRDHRTLQQSTMRDVIVPLLMRWATDHKAGRYDDRNEATVRAAEVMSDALRESGIHFPFI